MSHAEEFRPGSQPPPWLRTENDESDEVAAVSENLNGVARPPADAPDPIDRPDAAPPQGAAIAQPPERDLASPPPSRGWVPATESDRPESGGTAPSAPEPAAPAVDAPISSEDQGTPTGPVRIPSSLLADHGPPQQLPNQVPPPQYGGQPYGGPLPYQGQPYAPKPGPGQWPGPPPGYPGAPPAGTPQHGPAYPGSPQPDSTGRHHADPRLPPPPGLDPGRLVRKSAPTPERGWRRALHAASGGLINLGDSKSQQQLNEMVYRIRQPIRGDFRLAVLSLKGGVGKTTTTIGLGSAFASLRGDRVIAVDANPDLGTLASRVPQQSPSTVRTLLNDENIFRYTDVRQHTSQASSNLEVIASERDPAVSEAFTADEYRKVVGVLENFYNIIMTDCGTGLMHSAMEGVLSTANAIVLVTSPAVDGAQSASATLDWLNAHGYQRLVNQAVVVISASKPGGAPVDLDLLTEHFLGRTRAVQVIPYDEHLATGSFVELEHLHRRTRTAFLELAATVADSFATTVTLPPGGAAAPWQG